MAEYLMFQASRFKYFLFKFIVGAWYMKKRKTDGFFQKFSTVSNHNIKYRPLRHTKIVIPEMGKFYMHIFLPNYAYMDFEIIWISIKNFVIELLMINWIDSKSWHNFIWIVNEHTTLYYICIWKTRWMRVLMTYRVLCKKTQNLIWSTMIEMLREIKHSNFDFNFFVSI